MSKQSIKGKDTPKDNPESEVMDHPQTTYVNDHQVAYIDECADGYLILFILAHTVKFFKNALKIKST